jgi:DNA-binding response OmpR family regulator
MAKKILIVDDSGTSVMMARMVMSQENYAVVTARDGQEGVDKALVERPDLILMDVVMPRLDGFEATKVLRSHEETKGTPILLVTTRGEEANVERGYLAGCTDYICKPFNAVELLAKVKNYLAG